MKRENDFQAQFIQRIYKRFPNCEVLKNDSGYKQGIPDLTILLPGGMFAVIEVKRSADEKYQPNQEWYLEKFGQMCYSATVYPENEEAVLNDLQEQYQNNWASRIS